MDLALLEAHGCGNGAVPSDSPMCSSNLQGAQVEAVGVTLGCKDLAGPGALPASELLLLCEVGPCPW